MAILNNSNAISAGGYDINNSLRFRSSASARLSRTFGTTGTNNKIQTFSAWVKRGLLSSSTGYRLMGGYNGSANYSTEINFINDNLRVEFGGSVQYELKTTQVFRDPSAWYHIVVAIDTTQATSSNRVKMYVNGNQITAFATANYPAQNDGSQLTSANANNNIGASWSAAEPFDGYMADVNFIDGSAKTPSDFGETDSTTGVWKPKAYTGTYGTNGFYLKFSDIATTSGSNAGLGKDFSGNGNYWTTNNISVTAGTTYDAMTDVPTNTSATVANYAVMNPLNAISTTGGNTTTLSNANLSVLMPNTSASRTAFATIGVSSGKWYWETTITTGSINTYYPGLGIDTNLNALPTDQSGGTASGYMYLSNGQKFNNGSLTAYGASFTTNDVIGVALDMDAGTITFYKNNTSQGQAFSGITGTAVPCVVGQNNAALAINFGQRPFSYTPPTGFVALNTYNLPTPTILQGNKYMDATLYTGNGTSRTVTNTSGFKTDLVWVKSRNNAGTWHILADSVRGAGYQLSSNQTNAEIYDAQGVGFASNGFTLGADTVDAYYGWNINGDTYVGWQWQAGQGSSSSNTQGSITSTVSASTTAGFSVVTYTGNGSSSATVGHGLGVAPSMVIIKNRGATANWVVRHSSLTSIQNVSLTSDAAYTVSSGTSNGGVGAFTSTTFGFISGTVGLISSNASAATYVAYCWAAISGFSAFGSYEGNASADGPMIYLGFRPKFVLIKRSSVAGNDWVIRDSSRDTYNTTNLNLYANLSDAEASGSVNIDFLSNGFKLRGSGVGANGSGTYIYAAFAESPFKSSLAR